MSILVLQRFVLANCGRMHRRLAYVSIEMSVDVSVADIFNVTSIANLISLACRKLLPREEMAKGGDVGVSNRFTQGC